MQGVGAFSTYFARMWVMMANVHDCLPGNMTEFKQNTDDICLLDVVGMMNIHDTQILCPTSYV